MITHTANVTVTPFKGYALAGLLLIGASLVATPVHAAPGVDAGCPNINPELAISVGANESQFLKKEAKVVLTGDVTINQGVLHLAADQVTIKYLQGDTRDNGTQGKVKSLLARGTVKIVCENDRAHGGEALYDVSGRTIQLTHNVLLVREGNILKGETLFMDLDTGHMKIEGGGTPMTGTDTRIKAVFTPAPQDAEQERGENIMENSGTTGKTTDDSDEK